MSNKFTTSWWHLNSLRINSDIIKLFRDLLVPRQPSLVSELLDRGSASLHSHLASTHYLWTKTKTNWEQEVEHQSQLHQEFNILLILFLTRTAPWLILVFLCLLYRSRLGCSRSCLTSWPEWFGSASSSTRAHWIGMDQHSLVPGFV